VFFFSCASFVLWKRSGEEGGIVDYTIRLHYGAIIFHAWAEAFRPPYYFYSSGVISFSPYLGQNFLGMGWDGIVWRLLWYSSWGCYFLFLLHESRVEGLCYWRGGYVTCVVCILCMYVEE
jgi:hypothetical protein